MWVVKYRSDDRRRGVLDLAEDILKALCKDDMESVLFLHAGSYVRCLVHGDVEEGKKVLCRGLGQLHLPERSTTT